MDVREVYPNAPLRLVSYEMRFPISSRILTRSLWDELENVLGDELPSAEVFISSPDESVPHDSSDLVLRRISMNHKKAVTLYAGSVTIELADYQRYDDLRHLAEQTLAALGRGSGKDSVHCTRMGLRYINELKSQLVLDEQAKWHKQEAWLPFINKGLLGEVEDVPDVLCAFAQRGVLYFHSIDGEEQASLDYGVHPQGLVEPDGVLKLGRSTGPCFVLDIDASDYGICSEDPKSCRDLIKMLDRLHGIVEHVFQWAITDRSREIFSAPAAGQDDEDMLSVSCA
jgi:uncharacterized protein (TIGR04255 family)